MGRVCSWAFAALTCMTEARLIAQGDNRPSGTQVGDCGRTPVSIMGFQANLRWQRPTGKLLFLWSPEKEDMDQVVPACWALRGS